MKRLSLLTRSNLILIATLGSAAVLLGAYGFQHIGGLLPCKMCLWQRWPHAAAILIGIILLLGGPRLLIWLGALAAAITSFIGFYHAGVEWRWWPGPQSCTGGGLDMGAMGGSAPRGAGGAVAPRHGCRGGCRGGGGGAAGADPCAAA